MSSDDAWYVHGSNVYMLDASEYAYRCEKAEKKAIEKYLKEKRSGRAYEACDSHEDALKWADENYSEYGVWHVEE